MAPGSQARLNYCLECQAGNPDVRCMRENEADGLCPIADKAPELEEDNEVVLHLFNQAQGSANQIEGEKKNYVFLKPTEVESLMRINGIDQAEWDDILIRLFVLQDVANEMRPLRPKPKTPVRSR